MKRILSWILCVALLMGAVPSIAFAEESPVIMAKTVKLPVKTARLDLGGKGRGLMRAAVSPANANEPLVWATSNPKIATVDSDGMIVAHGKGTCTIGVRGQNTSWAKCKITVINTGKPVPAPAKPTVPVVKLRSSAEKLDINKRPSLRLGYSCSQSGAVLTWVSNNTSVATVDDKGTITAVGVGNCIVGARAEGGKWAKCKITVVNTAKPTSLKVSAESVCVAPGGSLRVEASVLPEKADQRVRWKVADSSIATVDQNGLVRGIRKGTTAIRVISTAKPSLNKTLVVSVSVNAPTSIQVPQTIFTVAKGTTFDIGAKAMPETAEQGLKFVSANTKVATVSSTGRVKAVSTGKAVIRIYSTESSAIYKSIGVKVSTDVPTSLSFRTTELYFSPGDSTLLEPVLTPAACKTGISYVSSDPSVVTVDASGRIRALEPGSARITATTELGALRADVVVTVLRTEYTTDIPARFTSISGMKGNLARIDAVAQSAYNALDAEVKTGSITVNEASSRKTQIKRAFAMYRFPWMTSVEQPYWRKSSSLNGAKDFRTGRVYYGLPYIQCGKSGDFNARRFNEQNAVSGGYYSLTSKGYYQMSQTVRNDGMYAGNDCSAFVSLALWGLGNAHSFDHTSLMLTTSVYKTIPWSREMMPGDILVMDGHCVIFLYYTNAARTQMMIIEQGGGSASDIHNTVCCSLVNVAAYRSAGYIIRRPSSYR